MTLDYRTLTLLVVKKADGEFVWVDEGLMWSFASFVMQSGYVTFSFVKLR